MSLSFSTLLSPGKAKATPILTIVLYFDPGFLDGGRFGIISDPPDTDQTTENVLSRTETRAGADVLVAGQEQQAGSRCRRPSGQCQAHGQGCSGQFCPRHFLLFPHGHHTAPAVAGHEAVTVPLPHRAAQEPDLPCATAGQQGEVTR